MEWEKPEILEAIYINDMWFPLIEFKKIMSAGDAKPHDPPLTDEEITRWYDNRGFVD